MKKNNKRQFFICNKFQKRILLLVFLSVLIPVVLTCACLYYLIFNIIANELVFPEAIAYSLIPSAKKVIIIILICVPFSLLITFWWAYYVSYKFAGPLSRLYRELDERIEGKTRAHIRFRKGDYLSELADKINALLDKLP
ncbi:MAG: hypothetical protein Q8O13_09520 [Candidatus Omnitrophota bacterium]|nr:hypothetical protein [Candidatus Omnitrophota bacterium]